MVEEKRDNAHIQEIRDFWNHRAGMGKWAGTNDIIAKQLEIKAIASYARDGIKVLDFGCGNGITAIEIARQFDVQLLGIDYAEEMIVGANSLSKGQTLKGKVNFQVGDVDSLSTLNQKFDLIYTERMLINLPDWPAQKEAIIQITKLLQPGGQYIMCENSQDGLEAINILRADAGLEKVVPPWHNRYLKDTEINSLIIQDVKLEGINYYSSAYYFLSRVVNAWLAKQEGNEPSYDASVNQLALLLPSFGEIGQGRIWIWRKLL
jgi:ubiquinone/menaquinone biosynthesis C-methylase UbiE